MRPLIIFHGACPDGAGSALAAFKRFGEGADYRPTLYDSEPPRWEEYAGRDVFMIDFSYSRAIVEDMASRCNLRIIDHHKSAEENLRGLPYATFDMRHSGATLAWMHFFPAEPIPELLQYIEDRDLWRWKLPHSKEVSGALKAMGATVDFRVLIPILEEWRPDEPSGLVVGSKRRLIAEGRAILLCESAMVEAMLKTAEQVVLAEHDAMACNTSVLFSEVPNRLLEEYRFPMAIGWFWDGARRAYQVSLRSVGDFDCTAVARKFGGGGHRNASGFTCKELPWRAK